MQQMKDSRRRERSLSPESVRQPNGGGHRRGSGKNGLNNRTLRNGTSRGGDSSSSSSSLNQLQSHVSKLQKSLEAAFGQIEGARRSATQEKEQVLSQLLKLQGSNDKLRRKVEAREYEKADSQKVELYMRNLEEQVMMLEKKLNRAKRNSLAKSVVDGERVTGVRVLIALLRVMFFAIVGVTIVFTPELNALNTFPGKAANATLREHLFLVQDHLASHVNWRQCMDRYGVFSITCILLHIVFETGTARSSGRTWLKRMIDEGVVLWALSIVVRSLVGIGEALATVTMITVSGMLLRGDWKGVSHGIVEESGAVPFTGVQAPVVYGEEIVPPEQDDSPSSENFVSSDDTEAPTQTILKRRDSEHIYDHEYEEAKSRMPEVDAKDDTVAPATLPKTTNEELLSFTDSVPVVNKDTGETMDLQFLEELNSQCHVFDSGVERCEGELKQRSSSDSPQYKPKPFMTPPPRRRSNEGEADSAFWSDMRQERKRSSLLKRLGNGGGALRRRSTEVVRGLMSPSGGTSKKA